MDANNNVRITHRGEIATATADTWQTTLDGMIERLGAYDAATTRVEIIADAPAPRPVSTFAHQLMADAANVARVHRQLDALSAGGYKFDESKLFYKAGTALAEIGYDAQRAAEIEHGETLPALAAVNALVDTIEAERRRDVDVNGADIARAATVSPAGLAIDGQTVRDHALRGLLTRADSSATSYLTALLSRQEPGDLALALSAFRQEMTTEHANETIYRLRTRAGLGDIFAAVSPGYTVADAPTLARSVLDELPDDARATWSYDPTSTAWELRAAIYTPTPTDQQAVGEPFRAFLSARSYDGGNGSIDLAALIEILRCLNASRATLDGDRVRRRHRGNVSLDLPIMLAKAARSLHVLSEAWGLARRSTFELSGLTLADAIPGIFRDVLVQRKGELVGVFPGRRETHVQALAAIYPNERRDAEQITRADVAQTFTRYQQSFPAEIRRNAESAAGAWLISGRPLAFAEA